MSGLAWFALGLLTAINAGLWLGALYLCNKADELLREASERLEAAL